MAINSEEARGQAAEYGAMARQRDRIVLDCLAADITISDTARLMGISRKTVYEVRDREARRQGRPVAADALDQLAARLMGDSAAPPVVFRPAAAE